MSLLHDIWVPFEKSKNIIMENQSRLYLFKRCLQVRDMHHVHYIYYQINTNPLEPKLDTQNC